MKYKFLSTVVEDIILRVTNSDTEDMHTIEYLMYCYLGTEKQDEYVDNYISLLTKKSQYRILI